MSAYYYGAMLGLSLIMLIMYVSIWHKHFDTRITLIFALVPVANLGYFLASLATTDVAYIAANKLTYIGGCYLQLIIMLAIFSQCKINVKRPITVALFVISTIIYLSSLTIGIDGIDIFYKGYSFKITEIGPVLYDKHYGFMHTAFYALFIIYFALGIGAIVYSYFKKKQVSRKTIFLLFTPQLIAVVTFFGLKSNVFGVDLVPATYFIGEVSYLIIVFRMRLYDIGDSSIDSLMENGDTGFVSFDFKYNYIGSNDTAKKIFPALNDLTVDGTALKNEFIAKTMIAWLNDFASDQSKNSVVYEVGEASYLVNMTYLFDGRKKRGYQLYVTDDTSNQKYIKLINQYNDELQAEVEQKTANIVRMHDNFILGMATMVESRDNSTGGHIKRTSQAVKFIIDKMQADGANFSEQFCRDVVKAAPMHDLGKIAVDDAILRKPGRYTPEEFEQMKKHAAEGAHIVRTILEDTDDVEFKKIAENVAHYHHERWDGSGYPEGLKGNEIPIEARIMAIADVYDALVSKRVYKEKMSFAEADKIIMEGMGKHFDPSLEKYYVAARPDLEKYYSEQE